MSDAERKPAARARTRVGLWIVPFVLGLPFALLFMLGDLIARPLEKHRHEHLAVWLLWNLLRHIVLIAIFAAGLYVVIRELTR